MWLRILLIAQVLLATSSSRWGARGAPAPQASGIDECAGTRPRVLFGLMVRPLTLERMVGELERGCLALEEVRFRAGQDTIEWLSPARFALVARALGMARGDYRVTVPPEAAPGEPPDTVQARRRGTRLRDELLHYGASWDRLVDDPGLPLPPRVAAPGGAVPMLVRVRER